MQIFSKLFPHWCWFCGQQCQRAFDLCSSCEQMLPWIKTCYCSKCGQILHIPNNGGICQLCPLCMGRSFPYDRIFALFHYQAEASSLILQLKFSGNLSAARILGHLLAREMRNYYQNRPKPELIIPVPLHRQRLKERGYNQALEIARIPAKTLGVKLEKFRLIRTKNTKPQAQLKESERISNLKRAFAVKISNKFKLIGARSHVVLVDDVITTGNTVTELSKVLRQAGVEKIEVWALAKTKVS